MNQFALFLNRYKIAFLALCGLILIGGGWSYSVISKEEVPSIKMSLIYINVHASSLSASDMERLIVNPIESRVRYINGVKSVESQSVNSNSTMIVKLYDNANIKTVKSDINIAIEAAKQLMPNDVEQITLRDIDLSTGLAMQIMLSGDLDELTLLRHARELKIDIESIPDVSECKMIDNKVEILKVTVDAQQWLRNGLSGNVFPVIASNNQMIRAGHVISNGREMPINISGVLRTEKEVLNVPIMTYQNHIITIKDIGTLHRDVMEDGYTSRVNFKTAVVMEVLIKPGHNLMNAVKNVREILAQPKWSTIDNVKIDISRDASQIITSRLSELINTVIIASILVIIIVMSQIGIKQGFVVGMSVPISFFGSVLTLYMLGYTMNIVVLFTLIMGIGMIVDASIIIMEYADSQLKEGHSLINSYAAAIHRMLIPIAASTFGIIIVYVPLLMWPGFSGQFIRFMPVTMITVLLWSIVSALVFVPVIGSMVCNKQSYGSNSGIVQMIYRYYESKLTYMLTRPIQTIGLCILVTIVMIVIASRYSSGVIFFPVIEPDFVDITVKSDSNLSLESKKQLTAEVESKIKPFMSDISIVYSVIGDRYGASDDNTVISNIHLDFVEWKKRRSSKQILADIKNEVSAIKNVSIEISSERKGPNPGKPINLIVQSKQNYDGINVAASTIIDYLRNNNNIINISDSRLNGNNTLGMTIDRTKATQAGVNIAMLSQVIGLMTNGMMLGFYYPDDSNTRLPILATFHDSYRQNNKLENMTMMSMHGKMVPIKNFVNFKITNGILRLEKIDGARVVRIGADITIPDYQKEISGLNSWLKSKDFGNDVVVQFGGDKAEQDSAVSFLKKAFIVAIILKIAILVLQFNSIYFVFVTMSAVFFSFAGIALGLIIFQHKPLVVLMSGMGMVSLAGIVVSNNIVLIDTYMKLMREGNDILSAVTKAALSRFRPIIMTSATTIIGLLPMVLNINIDFLTGSVSRGTPSGQWWEALSMVIAFGLFASTFFTLILTPSLLLLPNVFRKMRRQ